MKNKWNFIRYYLCLAVVLMTSTAMAGDLYVYPAKGQSQKKTEEDKFQCYQWAKNQSGFDPMATHTASSPPPRSGPQEGGVGRGLARGALLGVAVGAIAGNAGKGAAIGAASGGLIGGIRRQDQVSRDSQAQQQWANNQASNFAAQQNNYTRAYKSCLEGRNYSVR